MNHTTESLTFPVPLSFEAHALAQNSYQGISNSQKKKQVYLNTLAVYAVNSYLRCLGFETDCSKSDRSHPLMRKFLNAADLNVKKIGKLECRPVLPEDELCEIPAEVREDRVGYVAVQMDRSLKQATILGFSPTASATIPLNQLQSLEAFLEYLSRSEKNESIDLRQWFEGTIQTGWLTLNELLNPQQLELAFRWRNQFPLIRGQKIDLGIDLQGKSVALVVALPPQPKNEIDILVQIHPSSQTYLPQGVQLTIKDAIGEEILAATSRETDNFIQLEFSAQMGETFKIIVALGEVEIAQEFSI